jgi:hypothetical protein
MQILTGTSRDPGMREISAQPPVEPLPNPCRTLAIAQACALI